MNEISPEDRWLYNYTLPCTCGNLELFDKLKRLGHFVSFLNGDFSRQNVMDYFLGEHNVSTYEEKNYPHLVIPYEIVSCHRNLKKGEVVVPFLEVPEFLKDKKFGNRTVKFAKELGALEELAKGDVVISHCGWIIDSCKPEELKKYEHLYVK